MEIKKLLFFNRSDEQCQEEGKESNTYLSLQCVLCKVGY